MSLYKILIYLKGNTEIFAIVIPYNGNRRGSTIILPSQHMAIDSTP